MSDLFHSFLQDCTFVGLDVEVVDVVKVGKDQLGKLFNIFVLVLTVALLIAPLGTTTTKTSVRKCRHNSANSWWDDTFLKRKGLIM